MSLRSQLAKQLKPALPRSWVIVESSRTLESPSKMTLQIHQKSYRPARTQGAFLVDFAVNLICPQAAWDKAEDDFEDAIPTILARFQKIQNLQFSAATKSTYDGKLPAYEITVTLETNPIQ